MLLIFYPHTFEMKAADLYGSLSNAFVQDLVRPQYL